MPKFSTPTDWDSGAKSATRTNLGLGTAATHDATEFATAISLATPSVLYSTPVTFSDSGGTFSGTLSLVTQSANTVLAGPTTGTAATPTMRALVAADIPAIAESGVTNLVTDLAAKAPLASPTFTGRASIPAHTAAWNALPAAVSGTITIDWSAGDRWYGTLANGGTTLAYSNVPAAGTSQILLLRLTQPASGAAGTVTWPSGTTSPNPTLSTTNGKSDLLTVSVVPGGSGYDTILSGTGL